MFYNLTIKKLGDYVKITAVKVKTSSNLNKTIKFSNEKGLNNLIRAKNTIQDIVLANDFKYFFTLTFSPEYDRFNFSSLHFLFKKQLKLIRYTYNIDLKYIIVPEQHKNGAWHFHGFFNKDIKQFFLKNEYGFDYIPEFRVLGFHNFQVVKNIRKASSYVTKYISKNIGKGIDFCKHSYFCSKGLNRGTIIKDNLVYNNEFFNNKFFEFRNDFCCKRILTMAEYRKFSSILNHLS